MGKRIAWMLGIFLAPLGLVAQGIPVRVADFSVYDKPLSGFSMLLPVGQTDFREGLIAHLEPYIPPTSVFEDMVLCEQVHYAPVSVWQPLTLIFQFERETDQLIRLKAAAVIDYRQSVTVRNSPDLAIRLLLDLDQLTREVSGDSLDFDALFVSVSGEQLVKQYQARKARNAWNMAVERRPAEVVEETGMYLRSGRMEVPEQESPEDDAIVEEVSRRFRQYLDGRSSSPFLADSTSDIAGQYQDSLETLLAALNDIRRQNQQILDERDSFRLAYDAIRLQAGDLPAEVRVRLAALEQENRQLRAEIQELAQQPRATDTSVLMAIREDRQMLEAELQSKEQELGAVFARLEQLEQRERRRQESQGNAETEARELQAIREQWGREEADLLNNIQRLRQTNDSLTRVVLALNPESERARARQAVYLRQLQQLEAAQDNLVQRLWDVSNREKLVRQRELFLAEYERNGTEQDLLQRVSGLEEQLKQQAESSAREAQSPVTVEPAALRVEGEEIPAYAVRSPIPASWAREQLLAWCRLNELQLAGEDILTLTSSRLPGMEGPRYEWQMTMLDRGQGCIIYATFRQANGTYLNYREGSLESKLAIRLLQDVFR